MNTTPIPTRFLKSAAAPAMTRITADNHRMKSTGVGYPQPPNLKPHQHDADLV